MTDENGAPIVTLTLSDLEAASGVGFGELPKRLDGATVVLGGPLHREPDGSGVRIGRGVTSCPHAPAEATVQLVDPSPALDLVESGHLVRLVGRFSYGFERSSDGTASYLRLVGARPC